LISPPSSSLFSLENIRSAEIGKFYKEEYLHDYINEYIIPNPKIPSKEVTYIKLNRNSMVVTEALDGINKKRNLKVSFLLS